MSSKWTDWLWWIPLGLILLFGVWSSIYGFGDNVPQDLTPWGPVVDWWTGAALGIGTILALHYLIKRYDWLGVESDEEE